MWRKKTDMLMRPITYVGEKNVHNTCGAIYQVSTIIINYVVTHSYVISYILAL